MPWSYSILALNGAVQPDGSGSYNNMPTPAYDVSFGTQTTNTPKVTTFCWDFTNQATSLMWSCALPGGGPARLVFKWKILGGVTTGSVGFKGSSTSAYDDATDVNTVIFDPFVTSGGIAVPSTAGAIRETGFSLYSASTAFERHTTIMLGNDPSVWTTAGTLRLLAVSMELGI